MEHRPQLVAWEATRACNLSCVHCRAEAQREPLPGELSTEEAKAFFDDLATLAKPILILSGGEPMLRKDIYELAAYGTKLGFRVVMSPNGTLITPESVRRMKEAGIQRISVSLDGSDPEHNDSFRMVPGAFAEATRGLGYARDGGMPFQINTTITRRNLKDLPAMYRTVQELGAVTWDIFMLVPTGRGKIEDEVTPEEYEEVLRWVASLKKEGKIPVKVTCGPHFQRIIREEGIPVSHHPGAPATKGCMAGDGFVFVSYKGEVFPCGYFPISAGSIRETPFTTIYRESPLLLSLRDPDLLKGKCGRCEYRKVCGGCRARALGVSGDYLAEEPFCVYEPTLAQVSRRG